MQRTDNVRPVIIKRKKVVSGGGHHGGAWKVAYADFVTAMMAFFLMLWLLGSVTEDQRQGIADYFQDASVIPTQTSGAESILFGESARISLKVTERDPLAELDEGDSRAFEGVLDRLEAMLSEFSALDDIVEHIAIRVTDEGLVIEMFDLEHASLFDPETAAPRPVFLILIELVTEAFGMVENKVAIDVHSRSFPAVIRENPVWHVTTARAQATREAMQQNGLDPQRARRVTGHADRDLATENPMAARNNRVELILLREDHRR